MPKGHSKHRYSKDALIYWSGFLIASSVIVFVAHIIKNLAGGTIEEMDYWKLGSKLFETVLFLFVYRGAEDYITIVDEIELQKKEELAIEDHLISDED